MYQRPRNQNTKNYDDQVCFREHSADCDDVIWIAIQNLRPPSGETSCLLLGERNELHGLVQVIIDCQLLMKSLLKATLYRTHRFPDLVFYF